MPDRKPLSRELLVSLVLHVAAILAGAALPILGCADGCGEGTRLWTLVGGVALAAAATAAVATELARSLAGDGDGWARWAALLMLTGALTAAALAFLTRPPAGAQHVPLERGLAIVLLATASNALLALAGAGVARWSRAKGRMG